jgi:cell division transport system permease protein
MRSGSLIPFKSGGGVLMALIVAAMAFLACFALAGSLGASKLANAWTEGLSGAATVRIGAEEVAPERQLSIVIDILKSTEGVIDATPLTDDEVAALLKPWFGATPNLEDLPAPAIVAVTIDPLNEPDVSIVQARLDGAATGAVYDDHGEWRGRAASAAHAVRSVALGALFVCALAIAAVVVMSVRSGLSAQQANIATLRLAGAEDRYVAGLYQSRYFWLGLIGGGLGCLLALAVLVGFEALSTVSRALPALALSGHWWAVFLGVIIFVVALCVLAARFTVMGALRRGA